MRSFALDDARVMDAARATGADVPVCLDPRARMMRGIGEILSEPLDLPRLPAVLVNPGVAVPTKDVFAALAAPALSRAVEPDDSRRVNAGLRRRGVGAWQPPQRSRSARDQASARDRRGARKHAGVS